MVNVKISALPAATAINAADLLPVVQDGVTKHTTPDLLPLSAATVAALAGKETAGAAAAAVATQATAAAATYQPKTPGPQVVLASGQVAAYSAGRSLTSTATVAVWGHSYAWSDGGSLEDALAARIGATVFNGGIGGDTSTGIAIRQGGIVPLVTITGGQLPADTSAVPATVTPAGDYIVASGANPFTYTGTLAGVPVTLTYVTTAGTWIVARTTAGATATPVPAGTPFLITTPTYPDATTVFGLEARNNTFAGDTNLTTVIRDLDAKIGALTPYQPCYLVVSDITTTVETSSATGNNGSTRAKILASNTARAARYGGFYYDLRRDFIDNGLTIAGITPTAADTAAINGDTAPPSLMNAAGDHPNTTGYQVLGRLLADRLVAKGWAAAVAGPVNLLTLNQASIETDASAWSGNGDGNITVTRSTTQAAHGSASLLVTSGPDYENVILTNPGVAVTAGQNYGFTAKTRAVTTARTRNIDLYWYDSSHNYLDHGAGNGIAETTTGWTTVTYSQAAPAGAAYLRLGVASSGAAPGEQWYLDAVGLYAIAPGAAVPAFIAPAA